MRKLFITVFAALFLLPISAFAQVNSDNVDQIRVISAEFGQFYGENRRCNATPVVASICNKKASCGISASTALCGNPAPGHKQGLLIYYQCKNSGKTAWAEENHGANLSCP
jgi:hypothetical protein